MGRASRGGKIGLSISFITQYDLKKIARIESLIGEKLELEDDIEEEAALKNMGKLINAKKKAELTMTSKGEEDLFEKLRKRKRAFRESVQLSKKKKIV